LIEFGSFWVEEAAAAAAQVQRQPDFQHLQHDDALLDFLQQCGWLFACLY
jgi:hypothetical protein